MHVDAAARAFQETPHREQSVLCSVSDEIERWSAAKDRGVMCSSQPLYAESLGPKENAQDLMDPEQY